jgi:cytidyltransferase-like protein
MQRIVLNGCFDLLHRGHKYLISKALDIAGDGKAYILINSDRSVRELKGEERPINTQVLRVFYVNEFVREWLRNNIKHPTVNIKVFDSEEELMNIFTEIRPTVIVKGNDRPDVRDILGSDRWPVLMVPRIHDESGNVISTTSILDKAIS